MGEAEDTVEGRELESIFLPRCSQNQVANFLIVVFSTLFRLRSKTVGFRGRGGGG